MKAFWLYIRQLFQAEYYRNIATLITGSSLSQIILIGLTPILSRLFDPADFGLYSVFLTIVSLLGIMATGRYEVAILLPKKESEAQHLFQLSTALGLSFAFLLLLFIPFLQPFLVEWFGSDYQLIYFWLPFALAMQVLLQTSSILANRLKRYGNISWSRIVGSGTTSGSSLAFGWLQVRPLGLIYGKLIGMAGEVALLLWGLRQKLMLPGANWRQNWKTVMLRYRSFPRYSTFEALLNVGHKQLPVLALTALFGLSSAGWYSLANTLLSKPLGIVATSFSQVFYQQTAADEAKGVHTLNRFFMKNLWLLSGLALPPAVVVMVFGPPIFAFVLGEEWYLSGVYAAWLMPYLFVNFLKTAFSSLVDIKNKIRQNARWEGVFLLSGILAFSLGWHFQQALLAIQVYSVLGTVLGVIQVYWFYTLTSIDKQWH
ncbi:MAG: lipopolysaccharide biosynthesis protein [Saprospiraceae bacterium]|nr:lipopolysaccharide biosynthesis protein [Saprospiraceae bacterium]